MATKFKNYINYRWPFNIFVIHLVCAGGHLEFLKILKPESDLLTVKLFQAVLKILNKFYQ